MKLTRKEEHPENWDFDFSMYEEEDEETPAITSLKILKRGNFTDLRSRFSNGENIMLKLAELEKEVDKYCIKVAARSQLMEDLWNFYAVVDTYWRNIRDIYGKILIIEMESLKAKCRDYMEKYQGKQIPSKVHELLLHFHGMVYRLAQNRNLRFEVESYRKTSFKKAKNNIIQ